MDLTSYPDDRSTKHTREKLLNVTRKRDREICFLQLDFFLQIIGKYLELRNL
jgi:hypothetical protein